MLAKVLSYGLSGLDGFPVQVEVDASNGLPGWELVGLPDAAVKESRERVRSALKNSGFSFPVSKITVNLAPADLRKEGPIYDLAIAVGILIVTEQLDQAAAQEPVFLGELSLNGDIRPVAGVLPMVIDAKRRGISKMILAKENENEAAFIEGMEIIAVRNIRELANHLSGIKKISPVQIRAYRREEIPRPEIDFSLIKGQEDAKRAIEIAVAGGHNILMVGEPGSGKTMLAKSIPGILPDLTFEEALEVTKIHSVSGEMKYQGTGIMNTRPFRSPHHSLSTNALIGGGARPVPGEVSLAHNGVLFLDELPEFARSSLEALRQPLEDGVVTVARVNAKATYPANFMLVASMNPCPCGYFGSRDRECRCTPMQIRRYLSKISGPLLDRIDIQIEVEKPEFSELRTNRETEHSSDVKKRVDAARKLQLTRFKKEGIYCNAQMGNHLMKKYCVLHKDAEMLLKKAFEAMGLSARSYTRILLVARTIADLDGAEEISAQHIAEAIQLRALDRKYFNTGR